MSAIATLNPKAEMARAAQAMAINISAAKGIQEVLKTNLGPRGTMKMLVSGAGDIKITKDGNILLHEMQIQHPTASLIARASTAQDDVTGDGTTSTVLLIGELLKQAELYVSEGLHPRVITEGFELAKNQALEVLNKMRIEISGSSPSELRETLINVARTSLATKIHQDCVSQLAEICVDAVLAIRQDDKPIDLHMIEQMSMQHRSETDSQLVRGIVMDHGARHPDMKKRVENAYILTCNVSMEYEKTEVNSGFFYKTAEERDKLVLAERQFICDRVQKVIDLKRKVCADDKTKNFVVINQKGIDPVSLDMLAREGIVALRRAKRRNMERLMLACGGVAVNSVEELSDECLGHAGLVYEHVLGETKFTFVEQCKNPLSVTILTRAPTQYSLNQLKDAVRDGLHAIYNCLSDGCVVAGAGAFELAASSVLKREYCHQVAGRARLGVQAFADALLVVPKTLAANAGHDSQDTIVRLQEELTALGPYSNVGLDLSTGQPMVSSDSGVFDNFCVKQLMINSCAVIAGNLLLVDEIMRAGLSSLKN